MAALVLATGLLMTSSGCQLSRSFFQMDSNSRVPFFGVDLTPKWPKRSSATSSVSRLQNESTRLSQTTDDAKSPPREPSLALPLSNTIATAPGPDAAPVEQFR